MATQYRTKAGDTVDRICWLFYKDLKEAATELVYLANPNLADSGAILPAGIVINLPDLDAVENSVISSPSSSVNSTSKRSVKLWD